MSGFTKKSGGANPSHISVPIAEKGNTVNTDFEDEHQLEMLEQLHRDLPDDIEDTDAITDDHIAWLHHENRRR